VTLPFGPTHLPLCMIDAQLTCTAVQWVDDEPQPGLAEVQFIDVYGRAWSVVEKSAVLDHGATITPEAEYPFPWRIRCTVLDRAAPTVRIRLAHSMQSSEGTSEFEVDTHAVLPHFTYHPDPIGTGSIQARDTSCICCGQACGWIYVGPVFAQADINDGLCPWCIADGSAARRYDATFTDVYLQHDQPTSREIVEVVTQRTPGFAGWQQERWLFHCGNAAAFLGPMDAKELAQYPGAIESLRAEVAEFHWDTKLVDDYLSRLDRNGQPTAYVFRCQRCGLHLAYSDFT
jgi:uncharacterized protein